MFPGNDGAVARLLRGELSGLAANDLSSLAVLCPNHHRVVHGCDAQLDFGTAAFVLPAGLKELRLSRYALAL